MEASKHAGCRAAVVVLHKVYVIADTGSKIAVVEAFVKKSTLIAENVGLQQQDLWQVGCNYSISHLYFTRFSR
jgi:hypothetical protein